MMALKQSRSQSNLFRPWNPEDGKEEERRSRKEKRKDERRREERRKDERKKSSSISEDKRQLDKTGLIPSSESQEMMFHHSPTNYDPSFSSAFAQHLMAYPQFTNLPLLPIHQLPNPYLSANPSIPPAMPGQFDTALQFLTAAAAGETLFRHPKKQRPKRFSCPHCQVSFSNNGQLRGHIRIHTGKPIEVKLLQYNYNIRHLFRRATFCV